mmetsp:Transcript_32060/g.85145  ORF Transcript_32060/g.85145 Transcript_32060/m.85145 type:complete len:249 (-) Transcript_32060:544-1290(-)
MRIARVARQSHLFAASLQETLVDQLLAALAQAQESVHSELELGPPALRHVQGPLQALLPADRRHLHEDGGHVEVQVLVLRETSCPVHRKHVLERCQACWDELRVQEHAEIKLPGETLLYELPVLGAQAPERREHLRACLEDPGHHLPVVGCVRCQLLLELRQPPQVAHGHRHEHGVDCILICVELGRLHKVLDPSPGGRRQLLLRLLAAVERRLLPAHCPIGRQECQQGLFVILLASRVVLCGQVLEL